MASSPAQLVRWTRTSRLRSRSPRPGGAPDFDGIVCVDCGNRFRTEFYDADPAPPRAPTSNRTSSRGVGGADPGQDCAVTRKAGRLKPPEP